MKEIRTSSISSLVHLVVKRDYELAIHHADFVDDEVSTIGPFRLHFLAHPVCSVAFLGRFAQGAVQC